MDLFRAIARGTPRSVYRKTYAHYREPRGGAMDPEWHKHFSEKRTAGKWTRDMLLAFIKLQIKKGNLKEEDQYVKYDVSGKIKPNEGLATSWCDLLSIGRL